MEKLDEKSAAKFISALVKSVQALCHGYLDFHNGIEIIGHINLSVDKESSLHYILEEKVCKSEENSTMFISNSFYAQKAELQTKEKGCYNALSGSNSVHTVDPSDRSEVSKVSPVIFGFSSLSTSREKTHSPSTSSANETDLSCKTVSSPAKRKSSIDNDSVKSKARTSHFNPGLAGLVSQSPHRLANASSLDNSNPLMRELQGEDLTPDSVLPHSKSSRDIVNDIGVSLLGSVLEPVGQHTISDCSGKRNDSDGDLEEVTFIKKEFLDEEPSQCHAENSCGYHFGRGAQQTASSSSTVPEGLTYSASHPHSAAASSTYVPSAHSLGTSTAQLYGPSTSSSQSHQAISFETGSEGQKRGSSQLGPSGGAGFMMMGEASFTPPPLAHHAQSSLAHPALGLSVLDLSIKTEPRDPDFVLFDCEEGRNNSLLFHHSCPGSPRTEDSRQKAKERSKEYRMKQKIHRMTDSTYDMIFRHQVAERKRRQRMRERVKKLKLHGVAGYSIAK